MNWDFGAWVPQLHLENKTKKIPILFTFDPLIPVRCNFKQRTLTNSWKASFQNKLSNFANPYILICGWLDKCTVLTPKNCSNAIMQIKNIAKKLCEKQDLNILYVCYPWKLLEQSFLPKPCEKYFLLFVLSNKNCWSS